MQRTLFFLILAVGLFVPIAAHAQGPTPPPTTSTPVPICPPDWQETCEWGGAVVSNYGWRVLLGIALLLALVWLARRFFNAGQNALDKRLESGVEGWVGGSSAGDVNSYLEKVTEDFRYFKFRGLDTRARGIPTPELDQAYVSIHMTPKTEETETARKGRLKAAEKTSGGVLEIGAHAQAEVFDLAGAIQKADKLAIVGAAGSGKSTLLQWAGLAMTRARTDRKRLTDEMLAFVKAAGDKPLVPIYVPLRFFNRHCQNNRLARTAQSLLDSIRSYTIEKHPSLKSLPEDFFAAVFQKQGCLLMLDGVDEVDLDDRPLVRQAIEDLARDFQSNPRNRYLVTSRTIAYFGEAEVSGFRKCEAQNLDIQQRDMLIQNWCNAIYGGDDAVTQANDLIRRLNGSDERVRALAVTPLMVTIFALVHYNERELPKQRAELYEHAVRIILTEPYHEGEGAAELKKDWESRCRQISWIAFKMHADNLEDPPEEKLIDSIWEDWGAVKDEEPAREKARNFIRKVADRGGLLEEENGRYGFFTHRTFREFLAGRYLAGKFTPSGQGFLREHIAKRLGEDAWVEPVRLAAGFLAIAGDDDRPAEFVSLIENLGETPEQKTQALILAGLCAADLPRRHTPSLYRVETEKKLVRRMLTVLRSAPPVAEVRKRNQLGLALGEIGDPRFSVSVVNGVEVILPELIPIRAAVFRMGTNEEDEKILKEQGAQSWDDEKPAHTVSLSEYAIGKYLVTNAEFRCFWNQGGYDPRAKWWSDDGRKWRAGLWKPDFSWLRSEDLKKQWKEWLERRPVELRDRPFWWDDPKWNGANLPVVGIAWFEMEAYCNWLSHVASKPFRPPTEAEWEYAARGSQGFLWAWGNTWDSDRANTAEAEQKAEGISPVGMYPHGASPFDAEDMIGNVWEWCLDWYDENEYRNRKDGIQDPRGPETGSARVLRGGSWYNGRDGARCSVRGRIVPDLFFNVGFRVVCSPSFPSLHSDSLNSESLNPVLPPKAVEFF